MHLNRRDGRRHRERGDPLLPENDGATLYTTDGEAFDEDIDEVGDLFVAWYADSTGTGLEDLCGHLFGRYHDDQFAEVRTGPTTGTAPTRRNAWHIVYPVES